MTVSRSVTSHRQGSLERQFPGEFPGGGWWWNGRFGKAPFPEHAEANREERPPRPAARLRRQPGRGEVGGGAGGRGACLRIVRGLNGASKPLGRGREGGDEMRGTALQGFTTPPLAQRPLVFVSDQAGWSLNTRGGDPSWQKKLLATDGGM